jgi:hypothetical protein
MKSGCLKAVGGLLLIVIILLVVAGALLWINLPSIILKYANRELPALLQTQASLGNIRLALLKGEIGIDDLSIGQPAGYEGDALLTMESLDLKIDTATVQADPVVIEYLDIRAARIHLVKQTNSIMNTARLAGGAPDTQPTGVTQSITTEASVEKQPSAESKRILIRQITLADCAVTYTDHSLAKGEKNSETNSAKTLNLQTEKIDLTLTNLLIAPVQGAPGTDTAGMAMTARILQGKKEDALLGAKTRIGPVGGGIPTLNAIIALAGLELSTFGSIVPAGTSQALGGNAMDLAVELSLATNVLFCDIEVKMIAGNRHKLRIRGTPDKPIIDKSSILFNVLGRFGGGIGNVVGNVGSASLDLTKTAVGSVVNVGKGAGKTVQTAGKGLLNTAKGILTADAKQIGEGARQATLGTVKDAADTITSTGKGVTDGVLDAGSTTTGSKSAADWRKNTVARWDAQWERTDELIAQIPYPPTPLGVKVLEADDDMPAENE